MGGQWAFHRLSVSQLHHSLGFRRLPSTQKALVGSHGGWLGRLNRGNPVSQYRATHCRTEPQRASHLLCPIGLDGDKRGDAEALASKSVQANPHLGFWSSHPDMIYYSDARSDCYVCSGWEHLWALDRRGPYGTKCNTGLAEILREFLHLSSNRPRYELIISSGSRQVFGQSPDRSFYLATDRLVATLDWIISHGYRSCSNSI